MNATRRARLRERRRATPVRDLLFATALLAVALVPSWTLYDTSFLAITAGGGWLLGLGLAAALGLTRWPWYLRGVIGVAVALAAGVALAVPTAALFGVLPTLEGLGVLVSGLVRSWVDVLSVDPPLGTYDAVLVPVYVLALLGGVLAWAGARSGRRWLVLLGPAALLLYGIVFGARVGFHPLLVGAALLVLSLAWALSLRPPVLGVDARHTRALRAGAARRAVVGVAFAALCAVGGAYVAQAVAPDRRAVLRSQFEPEFTVQRQDSPLQEYRRWVTGEPAEQPVATVTGLPGGAMLRVAVMDEYNGVAMQTGNGGSSGTFTRLPSTLARETEASWDVSVKLNREQGQWLPVAGELSSVELPQATRDRLYFNRTLDAAVVDGGVEAGFSYTMRAVPAAAPLRSGLAQLSPGEAYQADLVQVPEELVDAGRAAWAKFPEKGAQLQAALSYLQAGGVSHGEEDEVFSRSGHSAQRLNLLAAEKPMVGDAEQYAAAFAVLAREVGFPARVVLGYVDADGDGTLLGSELTAWVEVQDASRGWVGVDPNPEPREIQEQDKSTEDAIARPRTVLPPDAPRQEDTITPRMDETPQQPAPEPDEWALLLAAVWFWTWRIGLALILLTSPLWVLVLIEFLRRRGRRRRDRKALTVTGAWDEVRDEAIDRGVPVQRAQTRSEVAGATGLASVAVLARRADELSFAPQGPDRAAVDEVWKQSKSARKELRSGRGLWARLRQRYSWRSVARWLRWMAR